MYPAYPALRCKIHIRMCTKVVISVKATTLKVNMCKRFKWQNILEVSGQDTAEVMNTFLVPQWFVITFGHE